MEILILFMHVKMSKFCYFIDWFLMFIDDLLLLCNGHIKFCIHIDVFIQNSYIIIHLYITYKYILYNYIYIYI